MLISELSQPLQYLDAKDDIVKLLRHVRESCIDAPSSRNLISELEAKTNLPFSEKSPFYYILLAYAYHTIPDWFRAKDCAERAETQFIRTDQKQNHAICNWLLGLLLCVYEDLDVAETKIEEARSTIQILHKNINQLGEYEISANKYRYSEIDLSINDSFTRLRKQVIKQISTKQNGLALEHHLFSRTIAQLSIPEELEYLENWIQDILASDPFSVPNDNSFVDGLFNRLAQISGAMTESALIHILLAHRFNLGYYMKGQQGVEAEEFARQAIGLFQEESVNVFLSRGYLSLLHYNSNTQGTGRANLDDAFWWLDRAQKEYEKNGFIENCKEMQNLRNDLLTWIFPFKFGEAEQPERPSSKWRIGNLIALRNKTKLSPHSNLAPKKSSPKTPEPETTPTIPFKRNETAFPLTRLKLDNRRRQPIQRQPPEIPPTSPPQGRKVEEENEPDVQLIVVPVDVRALEKTEINDSLASDDLFEKLANYDRQFYDNRMENNHRTTPEQRSSRQSRVIIPRYPIRGYATANPKGEADLPSADSSLPFTAAGVDETMILNIHNRSYLVHLLGGAREIHGNSQTHDWFQVNGDSMNNAKPIPIEDQDYVLFDKRSCSPEVCNGKIMLVSVRDANIEPTRLMVKRFVKLDPERNPGINETAYFLLSESRSKHKYKSIEFTDEYKIEGEVVAIAKLN